MPSLQTPQQVLDREFLTARCQLVELAALLDRVDRAAEDNGGTPDRRAEQLLEGFRLLTEPSPEPTRSERMLLLFTDDD